MERLTRKSDSGMIWFIDYEHKNPIDKEPCEMDYHNNRLAIEKLAEYEDLEEQCIKENSWCLRMLLHKWEEFINDIQELYKYRKLEEQGKLLKLPCKLGDTTFWISDEDENGNKIPTVRESNPIVGIDIQKDGLYILTDGDTEYEKVGTRWAFLSREEAEAALKEL